jgi:hypothetical protein
MSKNPPDWWARFFAGLGIIIGVCGLWLTYYNNRWQKEVYQQSLEERILVQLSAEYYVSSLLSEEAKLSPKGELAVEVVNLGMQPMYLKSVTAKVEGRTASFYEHDPLNTREAMRRLEPGEAASYKIEWQFGEQEAPLKDLNQQKGVVEVETTKKRFSQSAQIGRITIVGSLPLVGREFRRLEVLPKKKK